MLSYQGLNNRQSQYALLVIRWQFCQLLYADLERGGTNVSSADLRKVQYAFEQLANYFAEVRLLSLSL